MRENESIILWRTDVHETEFLTCNIQQPAPYFKTDIVDNMSSESFITRFYDSLIRSYDRCYPPNPTIVGHTGNDRVDNLMKKIIAGANQLDIINQETFKRNGREHKDY